MRDLTTIQVTWFMITGAGILMDNDQYLSNIHYTAMICAENQPSTTKLTFSRDKELDSKDLWFWLVKSTHIYKQQFNCFYAT